jgi:hypothetical protein
MSITAQDTIHKIRTFLGFGKGGTTQSVEGNGTAYISSVKRRKIIENGASS